MGYLRGDGRGLIQAVEGAEFFGPQVARAEALEQSPVLPSELLEILFGATVRSVDHEGRQPGHAAQGHGALQRAEELGQGEAVKSIELIRGFRAAGGQNVEGHLAFEGGAPGTIGPAEAEHQVDPLLDQRRGGIPVERMMEDDDVVGQKQALLFDHVDVEVWIDFVEIPEGDVRGQVAKEGAVAPGLFQSGMGEGTRTSGIRRVSGV